MTANANTLEPPSAMADQYYAMAEAMNSRGAMELAVPFYRQAVALLLAERASLQAQLGGTSSSTNTGGSLPMEELQGLLKAAEVLQQQGQEQPKQNVESQPAATKPSLDTQIAELQEELSRDTALQVIAGLKALAESNGNSLPASGLALLGKAQMLLGRNSDGLKSFEAALAVAPQMRDLQINTGAARLANGNVAGALTLLRSVWAEGLESLEPTSRSALLRNLAAAEAKAGNAAAALQLRHRWLQLDPQAVGLERWLGWAQAGLNGSSKGEVVRDAALALLKTLQEQHPSDRTLLQVLADALEDQGDYRDAALIYRQLLRPEQA